MLITLKQLKSALQAVKDYVTSVVPTKVSDLTDDSGHYTKPSGGIPASDLASNVQNSISLWKTGTGENSIMTQGSKESSGSYSYAEGYSTTASGNNSHSEGGGTTASGSQSHAEGASTTASGNYSHAEGAGTTASGNFSHAEGAGTTATGDYSHAEGNSSAKNNYSHAEGSGTTASGSCSHAEGGGTIASGYYSHAENGGTTASGDQSHAEGSSTIAASNSQHVQGKFNIEDSNGKYAHIVGNGTYNSRSNAHTLDWSGNAWFAGKVTVGTAPTANMDVATKGYVDTAVSSASAPPEIFIGSTTPEGYTMYIDPEGMIENAKGVSF